MATRLRKIFDQAVRQKVVSMEVLLKAKEMAKDNIDSMPSTKEYLDEGGDPVFALYTNTQNLITIFGEQVTTLEPLHRINDFISRWQETYEPALPPWSPISKSYFNSWVMFDVGFGLDKETISTCFLALMDRLPLEPIQREIAKNLDQSRMGIYEIVQAQGQFFFLRELITEKQFNVLICSGYESQVGDLIFLRIVPPLAGLRDYHVSMTTPYKLVDQSKEDWIRYFARHEIHANTVGAEARLHRHMKYGKNHTYWSEFIFYGYANYGPGIILTAGFPDQPETQPQHEKYISKNSQKFQIKENSVYS